MAIQSAYNDHIRALAASGRYDEAFDAAQTALQLEPDNPDTLDNLGIVQVRRGDWEGAASSIQKAIDLRPHDGDFHNHLGVALQVSGREKEAEVEFAEAVRLKPELSKQEATDRIIDQTHVTLCFAWEKKLGAGGRI